MVGLISNDVLGYDKDYIPDEERAAARTRKVAGLLGYQYRAFEEIFEILTRHKAIPNNWFGRLLLKFMIANGVPDGHLGGNTEYQFERKRDSDQALYRLVEKNSRF